jgi:UDP-N-acetylmuramoylalanine--D-glutamate ligase
MNLQGTQALVVGMKKSGLASAALLAREGAVVRATDIKPLDELPGVRELNIPFAQQTPEVFQSAELIVLSPDVPADLAPLAEARQRGVPVIGEVELAAPFLKGRTIGITGSNGKTTTTSLIGYILRESGVTVQVGGNIGLPVTAMIDTSADDGWNVLELSSFQLETIIEFRAHIALALTYAKSSTGTTPSRTTLKGRPSRPVGTAVLNAEDAVCVAYVAAPLPRRSGSAAQGGVSARRSAATSSSSMANPHAGLRDPHRGRHNIENVLPPESPRACAGVSRESIAAAVRTFRAVEHRLNSCALSAAWSSITIPATSVPPSKPWTHFPAASAFSAAKPQASHPPLPSYRPPRTSTPPS